ncbi:MAG: type II toxin-antitoxin system YafQ family toxin [Deltaproteobacteria bacterium]|nr:type II toxin-antitoxin system YafQ family toxin [Deltaproteobacteria bacterium]
MALTARNSGLTHEKPVPAMYKDRPLKGNWTGYRDIRIQSDRILIHRISGNSLYLTCTGRHLTLIYLGANIRGRGWFPAATSNPIPAARDSLLRWLLQQSAFRSKKFWHTKLS